jgi:hypothetical protein
VLGDVHQRSSWFQTNFSLLEIVNYHVVGMVTTLGKYPPVTQLC